MLRLRLPPGHDAERRWAADVVLGEFLGLEHACEQGERVELTDGTASLELPDALFSLPREEWGTFRWESGDVFGVAFLCLTRYEETIVAARDAHGRFPRSESRTHGPVVHEEVERLWSSLAQTWPRLRRRPRTFRVVPSHDVDSVGLSPLRWIASDLLTRHDASLAARRLAARVQRDRDPVWSFDLLMEESERRGLRSAFYFIASDDGPPAAADYSLFDPRLQRLLRRIHERGHEIGLHPSYDTFGDAERLAGEAATLRRALERAGVDQAEIGGRQHFLRWAPSTWADWEEAGLAYDSSVGWPDAPGFRAGCCYEYPAFDLERSRPLRLRERPLLVMDVAAAPVVRPSGPEARAAIAAVRDECLRYDGDFTVLWHNEWVSGRDQLRLYRHALG